MIIGDGVMEYIMDRVYARELLEHVYKQNSGPWYKHSIHVAPATENIILEFMKQGYDVNHDLAYNAGLLHDIGRYKGFTKYDLYDKVITLCDALADDKGFTTLEKRLISVGLRHGTNAHTSSHWKGFYKIKKEIEALIGISVYRFLPGVEESIYNDIQYWKLYEGMSEMRKNIYLSILIIVFLSLIGCSNVTTSSTTEQKEEKETSIVFEEEQIKEINLVRIDQDNISKAGTDNEDLINQIVTAIKAGTSKKISLDKKVRDAVHANMEVIFKDDSKGNLLVWIDDKNNIIIAKDVDKGSVQGIQINENTPKIVLNFLKQI